MMFVISQLIAVFTEYVHPVVLLPMIVSFSIFTSSAMMTREQATQQVRQMELPELIAYWNSKASDHYCRMNEIARKDDQEWFDRFCNEFKDEYSEILMDSIKDGFLKYEDDYIMYSEFDNMLVTFSTIEELMDIIGFDWFVDSLIDEE